MGCPRVHLRPHIGEAALKVLERPSRALVRLAPWLLLLLMVTSPLPSRAASTVAFAWDASSSAGVTGYRLHYGTSPRRYTRSLDAGASTTAVVGGLADFTKYYFAVTAYNRDGLESGFSNEVAAVTTGPLSGTFSGSVLSAAGSDLYVELSVSRPGVFTGRLLADGIYYSIRGRFNPKGIATVLARSLKPGLRSRTVVLNRTSDGRAITAKLSVSARTATVSLVATPYSARKPAPGRGTYTMRIGPLPPARPGEQGYPAGWGYGRLTITPRGSIRLAGRLPDEQPFTASALLKQDGRFPVTAASSRRGEALFAGTFSLQKVPRVNDGSGVLRWFGRTGVRAPLFAELSIYRPSAASRLPKSPFQVVLAGGGLPSGAEPVLRSFAFANGRLHSQNPGSERLSLRLDHATGLLAGQFVHPSDRKWHRVRGVLFQRQAAAFGLFRGPKTVGRIEWRNVPTASALR
jgi:hypothetical protein